MYRQRRVRPLPFNAEQRLALGNANEWMVQGKPGRAAPIYAILADAMLRIDYPRLAANLYARAAHAYADARDEQATLNFARKALALYAQYSKAHRFLIFFTNITRKMTTYGMSAAELALQSEFGSQISPLSGTPLSVRPRRSQLLPTNCPQCGAPLRAEQADWVDEDTIQCNYCSSLIRMG